MESYASYVYTRLHYTVSFELDDDINDGDDLDSGDDDAGVYVKSMPG